MTRTGRHDHDIAPGCAVRYRHRSPYDQEGYTLEGTVAAVRVSRGTWLDIEGESQSRAADQVAHACPVPAVLAGRVPAPGPSYGARTDPDDYRDRDMHLLSEIPDDGE